MNRHSTRPYQSIREFVRSTTGMALLPLISYRNMMECVWDHFVKETNQTRTGPIDDYEFLRRVDLFVVSLRLPYLRYVEACVFVAQPVPVHVPIATANNAAVMSFCGNADWTRELMSFVNYDEDDMHQFRMFRH